MHNINNKPEHTASAISELSVINPNTINPNNIIQIKSLKKYIKTIGLYNAKAKNIIALCKILIDEHDSAVPDNFDQLIKLCMCPFPVFR
jgi:endonuclease III